MDHDEDKPKMPIDQFLLIREITPLNVLKLHSNPSRVRALVKKRHHVKLSRMNDSQIFGVVKTDLGVHTCGFDIDAGVQCSCGFKNAINDNFGQSGFCFVFCDHVTVFLISLLKNPDDHFQKYVADIVPKAVKDQYVLNYLFEKGLIYEDEKDGYVKCSQFGKLIIRLYIRPVSAVLIREKLEAMEMHDQLSLIQQAYEVLKAEHRVRNYKMLEPILEWVDEVPVEQIVQRYNIMAGDLHSTRENVERILVFIRIIAVELSQTSVELRDSLLEVSEWCETLEMRLHHGIKQELLDLVQRIRLVGRVRGRILFDAGYHTASQVRDEDPYLLHQKTGLGVNLCKKFVQSLKERKRRQIEEEGA
jgi:replicative superfamily II helicase